MRILYIITKANWGGAQKYVYELATAAKAAGHEIAVATGGEGILTEKLDAAGIRTVSLPMRQRRAFLLDLLTFGSVFSLVSFVRAERPDIVHVNSAKAGGLGTLAARFAGVKRIVFTAHGWAWNEDRPLIARVAIGFFSWLTVLLAHQTICVSRAILRGARFMPFVRHKLVVIYNGVAAPRYLPRASARTALWPSHESGTWIGMLSELHPTKRVEDALKAFALLRVAHPETRLVILGEGEEHARLAWLIRESNLAGYAHLAGFVPDADRYLACFDIFLHSSKSEALSLAVIEAGLAALPVVATRVGGIPEIVADGESGLLAPAGAPAALAHALATLIEDPARAARLGEALKSACRERFDNGRMARETLALYT